MCENDYVTSIRFLKTSENNQASPVFDILTARLQVLGAYWPKYIDVSHRVDMPSIRTEVRCASRGGSLSGGGRGERR